MESVLGTFPGKHGPWHFPKLVHTYVSCWTTRAESPWKWCDNPASWELGPRKHSARCAFLSRHDDAFILEAALGPGMSPCPWSVPSPSVRAVPSSEEVLDWKKLFWRLQTSVVCSRLDFLSKPAVDPCAGQGSCCLLFSACLSSLRALRTYDADHFQAITFEKKWSRKSLFALFRVCFHTPVTATYGRKSAETWRIYEFAVSVLPWRNPHNWALRAYWKLIIQGCDCIIFPCKQNIPALQRKVFLSQPSKSCGEQRETVTAISSAKSLWENECCQLASSRTASFKAGLLQKRETPSLREKAKMQELGKATVNSKEWKEELE